MHLAIYQVDAFSDKLFAGNPAAVCPLDAWLPESTMQSIAAENNLSETAFIVAEDGGYAIRWFTPTVEVDLCGHATLASAWVVFHRLAPERETVKFRTLKAGDLIVTKVGKRIALDLPAWPAKPTPAPTGLLEALGGRLPIEILTTRDHVCVYEAAADITGLAPNFAALAKVKARSVSVTAPGTNGVDFVCRFFSPAQGIPEDPVTGSAYCTLAPFWAARLGKNEMQAQQLSRRGGSVHCVLKDDRVIVAGDAVLFLEGRIQIP